VTSHLHHHHYLQTTALLAVQAAAAAAAAAARTVSKTSRLHSVRYCSITDLAHLYWTKTKASFFPNRGNDLVYPTGCMSVCICVQR